MLEMLCTQLDNKPAPFFMIYNTVFCINFSLRVYSVSFTLSFPIRETHTLAIEDKGPAGLHHWNAAGVSFCLCVCVFGCSWG